MRLHTWTSSLFSMRRRFQNSSQFSLMLSKAILQKQLICKTFKVEGQTKYSSSFFFNGDFVFRVPLPASARCKLSDYWESCTWVAVHSLLTLIFSKKCYLMYLVLWLTSKMKVAEWASVTLRPTSSYSHATHHY